MDNDTLTTMDLTELLPPALREDPDCLMLAQVIAEQRREMARQVGDAILYARIEELPEAVLDMLAYDLKVDWYDYDYPLEIKRATIKKAMQVHRRKGTKYAVETAISEIYPNTRVMEWFEYGGKPYYFKLLLDVTYEGVDPARHRRVLELMGYYKNLRSVLEQVEYVARPDGKATTYVGAASGGAHLKITAEVKVYGLVK